MIKEELNKYSKKNNFHIIDLMPFANNIPRDLQFFLALYTLLMLVLII